MTRKMLPADWTEKHVSQFWDYTGSRPHRQQIYFSRLLSKPLERLLRMALVVSGRALDFGCGPGFLTEVLCRFPVEVFACDSSPKALEETQKRCSGKAGFRGAALVAEGVAPYSDGHFNFISFVETIEHLPAQAAEHYLRELRRLTAPNGVVMVTTPNAEDLEAGMIYCPFCEAEFHHMQHFRSFTAESLRDLLIQAEFQVEFCEGIQLEAFSDDAPFWYLDWKERIKFTASAWRNHWFPPRSLRRRLAPRILPGRHLVAFARRPE